MFATPHKNETTVQPFIYVSIKVFIYVLLIYLCTKLTFIYVVSGFFSIAVDCLFSHSSNVYEQLRVILKLIRHFKN